METGETMAQTAVKELREEVGFEILSQPKLLGVYKNNSASKRDHVAVYKAEKWRAVEVFKPNREIAEMGFFALDNLPNTITAGNLNRIREIYFGEPISEYW